MSATPAAAWSAATEALLTGTRAIRPEELHPVLDAVLAPLGVRAAAYLVDHEQLRLHPLPGAGAATPLEIDDGPAGAAFTRIQPLADGDRLWYPLMDSTERLGVIVFDGAATALSDPDLRAALDRFVTLLGHMVSLLTVYGDEIARVRRTAPMSTAAELLWRLLPPLTTGTHDFVVSAILEPCYQVAGDAFDYALRGSVLHVSLYDSTGHSLQAGLTTAVTLSAVRAARVAGADLVGMARAADRALTAEFDDARFTTAVLGELDLDTGRLRYLNAGHPAPLVLRGDRLVGRLDDGGRTPLGVPDPTAGPHAGAGVAEVRLERGDRVLGYSDGVVEAVDRSGREFGLAQLTELALRRATDGLPAPETLRRLCHDVLGRYDGPPSDDATLMLLEWSRQAVRRVLAAPDVDAGGGAGARH